MAATVLQVAHQRLLVEPQPHSRAPPLPVRWVFLGGASGGGGGELVGDGSTEVRPMSAADEQRFQTAAAEEEEEGSSFEASCLVDVEDEAVPSGWRAATVLSRSAVDGREPMDEPKSDREARDRLLASLARDADDRANASTGSTTVSGAGAGGRDRGETRRGIRCFTRAASRSSKEALRSNDGVDAPSSKGAVGDVAMSRAGGARSASTDRRS